MYKALIFFLFFTVTLKAQVNNKTNDSLKKSAKSKEINWIDREYFIGDQDIYFYHLRLNEQAIELFTTYYNSKTMRLFIQSKNGNKLHINIALSHDGAISDKQYDTDSASINLNTLIIDHQQFYSLTVNGTKLWILGMGAYFRD